MVGLTISTIFHIINPSIINAIKEYIDLSANLDFFLGSLISKFTDLVTIYIIVNNTPRDNIKDTTDWNNNPGYIVLFLGRDTGVCHIVPPGNIDCTRGPMTYWLKDPTTSEIRKAMSRVTDAFATDVP